MGLDVLHAPAEWDIYKEMPRTGIPRQEGKKSAGSILKKDKPGGESPSGVEAGGVMHPQTDPLRIKIYDTPAFSFLQEGEADFFSVSMGLSFWYNSPAFWLPKRLTRALFRPSLVLYFSTQLMT